MKKLAHALLALLACSLMFVACDQAAETTNPDEEGGTATTTTENITISNPSSNEDLFTGQYNGFSIDLSSYFDSVDLSSYSKLLLSVQCKNTAGEVITPADGLVGIKLIKDSAGLWDDKDNVLLEKYNIGNTAEATSIDISGLSGKPAALVVQNTDNNWKDASTVANAVATITVTSIKFIAKSSDGSVNLAVLDGYSATEKGLVKEFASDDGQYAGVFEAFFSDLGVDADVNTVEVIGKCFDSDGNELDLNATDWPYRINVTVSHVDENDEEKNWYGYTGRVNDANMGVAEHTATWTDTTINYIAIQRKHKGIAKMVITDIKFTKE